MKQIQFFVFSVALAFLLTGNGFATQKEEVQGVTAQLKEILEKIPGVQTIAVGNVIVIEGEIKEASEMDRVARLTEAMKDLADASGKIVIRNMTTISQSAKESLAENITKQINTPGIEAHFIKDTLFLEGTAENDYQADRSIEIAKAFFRTSDNGWSNATASANENREPAKVDYNGGLKTHSQEAGVDRSPIWGRITVMDLMRVKPRAASNKAH